MINLTENMHDSVIWLVQIWVLTSFKVVFESLFPKLKDLLLLVLVEIAALCGII